jgi:hypothetical protein
MTTMIRLLMAKTTRQSRAQLAPGYFVNRKTGKLLGGEKK